MLKAQVESLEEVPEGLKEHYAEGENGYVLQVEGMKTESDVSKVQEALDKERKSRRDAEKELKELKSKMPDDFDPDEWKRLKDNDVGDVDSKLEEQRKKVEQRYEGEKEKLQKELEQRDKRIQDLVARDGLHKAMNEVGIADPFKPAVEAMFLGRVSVEEEGDSLAPFIDGKPMQDALSEFANSDQGKHYVAAPSNAGGGANGGGGSGGDKNPWTKESFNLTEQGRIKREDPQKAERLKREAGAA